MKPHQKDAHVNTSHKKGVHADLNTTVGQRRAFLVCFWCLALWEDILLSSTAFWAFIVKANIYPVFELLCVCCGECLSIRLPRRDRSPGINIKCSRRVADNRFSVSLPSSAP